MLLFLLPEEAGRRKSALDKSRSAMGALVDDHRIEDASEDDTTIKTDNSVGDDDWQFATGANLPDFDDESDALGLVAQRTGHVSNGMMPHLMENDAVVLGEQIMPHSSPVGYPPKRSDRDAVAVTLYVVNHCTKTKLELSWMNYEGTLVPRAVLEAGTSHMEQTWSSHPWRLQPVVDDRGDRSVDRKRCMGVVLCVGEVAAKRSPIESYSLLWQLESRALSFQPMISPQSQRGLRSDMEPEYGPGSKPKHESLRGHLVHQLRCLRIDPSGGLNGGKPPSVTIRVFG